MIPYNIGNFQLQESVEILEADMTAQRWFIRNGSHVSRSVLYLLNDEWVVAFQDCVDGENKPLYMDEAFMSLHKEEPEYEVILRHSGVFNTNKIQAYSTGR